MGMATDFSAHVSKDTSGSNFHLALAKELERFLAQVLDKFGGVIGLIDLYCMYNRARGTDLISPDDLKKAAQEINKTSEQYMLREYQSGCKTIQSRMFNEDTYYGKMAEVLAQNPGLTPLRLAEHMCVNEILVKEHIYNAEAAGYVCKDESHEGTRFYDNKIMKWQ